MITGYSNVTSVTTLDYQYLFDEVSANTQFGFSYWKLRSGYGGSCLQVRRSSDNAILDVGFVDYYLDLDAIVNFCGSSQGYMTQWYDQSVNAATIRQTNATSQPLIWNGTSFESTTNPNGDVILAPYFDGSNDELVFNAQPVITVFTLFATLKISTTWFNSGYGGILTDGGGGDIFHSAPSLGYCYFNGSYNVLIPKTSLVDEMNLVTFSHNNSNVRGYLNGVQYNQSNVSTSFTRRYVMGQWAGGLPQGHCPEMVAYDVHLGNTERENVESNTINRYNL
jgi:hypothetical protein